MPTRSVRRGVAMAAATLVESAWRLMGKDGAPPASPWVIRLLTLDVIYDSTKAVERLGWEPRMQPLEGIAKYAALLSNR